MPALSRRQLLRHASGVALALPCDVVLPADGETVETAPQPACTVGVATLRRGESVSSPGEEICRATSGSPGVFQAASLSKPVVASLALNLSLRGTLDLDQPLSELLPEGYVHRQNLFALQATPIADRVPQDMLKQLTSRMLLSHTSGLPNWSATGPLQLSFQPGARWQYSGEGFVLLQHLLERLTVKPLQELASEELFQPLGLQDSAFKLTDRVAQSLIPGRSASGQVHQLRFPFEIAANSLYTSAADYARFMSSVLVDERLLSLVTRAPVPVPSAANVFWGLGWGIERVAERQYIWHWGSNPGFRALAMADVESRDAVVVLAATETGMPLAKSRVQQALPGRHPGLEFHLVR